VVNYEDYNEMHGQQYIKKNNMDVTSLMSVRTFPPQHCYTNLDTFSIRDAH